MSGSVIGYWIDHVDGESDAYWCERCVETHGKSTNRPVWELVVPLRCACHLLGANPEEWR